MLKVGITGGMGSGKSTVAKIAGDMGYPVVDADKVAREVLDLYPEISMYIITEYGGSYFKDGKLDRKKFANTIFKDPQGLKKYEGVIMPFIIKRIKDRLNILEDEGNKIAFLDAPLLFEERENLNVDISIVVDIEPELQIKRIMEREGLDIENIKDRLRNQMSREDRLSLADYVIKNDGTMEDLDKRTRELIREIVRSIDEKKKQGLQ